jgi:hypothetical protein
MDWKSVSSFFGREIVQTFCIAQSTMSVWTTTHSTRPYPILGPLRTETTRNLLECTATIVSALHGAGAMGGLYMHQPVEYQRTQPPGWRHGQDL